MNGWAVEAEEGPKEPKSKPKAALMKKENGGKELRKNKNTNGPKARQRTRINKNSRSGEKENEKKWKPKKREQRGQEMETGLAARNKENNERSGGA